MTVHVTGEFAYLGMVAPAYLVCILNHYVSLLLQYFFLLHENKVGHSALSLDVLDQPLLNSSHSQFNLYLVVPLSQKVVQYDQDLSNCIG